MNHPLSQNQGWSELYGNLPRGPAIKAVPSQSATVSRQTPIPELRANTTGSIASTAAQRYWRLHDSSSHSVFDSPSGSRALGHSAKWNVPETEGLRGIPAA